MVEVKGEDKKIIGVVIEVKDDNDLFSKVIKLRDEAEKSGWIFGECEDGREGSNLGVNLNKKKNLIKDIVLCSAS